MDAVISYLLVFLCALLVSLGVIYAYQRGKQAGKLESEKADNDTKSNLGRLKMSYGRLFISGGLRDC